MARVVEASEVEMAEAEVEEAGSKDVAALQAEVEALRAALAWERQSKRRLMQAQVYCPSCDDVHVACGSGATATPH